MNPEGLTFSGSSLVIDEAITLRHYYQLEEGYDIANYPITVDGEALEWSYNSVLDVYYVEFEVGAIELSKQFELCTADKVILACSVMDYCDIAIEESKDKAELKMLQNVINALYNYRWAANDYFVPEN